MVQLMDEKEGLTREKGSEKIEHRSLTVARRLGASILAVTTLKRAQYSG